MNAIEQLPGKEQEDLFLLLARKLMSRRGPADQSMLGKSLSFEEACDVVFRENRELLGLLAK